MLRFILTVIFLLALSTAGLAHTGEKHEELRQVPPPAEAPAPQEVRNHEMGHEEMSGASETRSAPQVPLNPTRDVVFLLIFTAGGIWLTVRNRQHFSKGTIL